MIIIIMIIIIVIVIVIVIIIIIVIIFIIITIFSDELNFLVQLTEMISDETIVTSVKDRNRVKFSLSAAAASLCFLNKSLAYKPFIEQIFHHLC